MGNKTAACVDTKQALQEAFWELYKNKSIEKISVREITERAGYNRGTFYLYYKDVYDILEQSEQLLIREIYNTGFFPEGKNDPKYNTADAALLFINCVWLYYQSSGDEGMVREMYPVMERIVRSYRNGTEYDIYMDEDGLISAGSGLDQVTWMDVRAGEILPTPRHGKPVEINAYWYNALWIMGMCSRLLGDGRADAPTRSQACRFCGRCGARADPRTRFLHGCRRTF